MTHLETRKSRISTESIMTPADPVPKRKNIDELSLLANRKSRAPTTVWVIMKRETCSSSSTLHLFAATEG